MREPRPPQDWLKPDAAADDVALLPGEGAGEKVCESSPECDNVRNGEVDRLLDELTRMNANQLRQINKLRALIKK